MRKPIWTLEAAKTRLLMHLKNEPKKYLNKNMLARDLKMNYKILCLALKRINLEIK